MDTLGTWDPDVVTNEGVTLPARRFTVPYHTTRGGVPQCRRNYAAPPLVTRIGGQCSSTRTKSSVDWHNHCELPRHSHNERFEFHAWLTGDTQKPWTFFISRPTV